MYLQWRTIRIRCEANIVHCEDLSGIGAVGARGWGVLLYDAVAEEILGNGVRISAPSSTTAIL